MMSLVVYDVRADGELDNIDRLDKNVLSSEKVLIVIAENNKKIYLWKGKTALLAKNSLERVKHQVSEQNTDSLTK